MSKEKEEEEEEENEEKEEKEEDEENEEKNENDENVKIEQKTQYSIKLYVNIIKFISLKTIKIKGNRSSNEIETVQNRRGFIKRQCSFP